VTLDHLYALVTSISPVAVHDEGNMLWDWARFENTEKDTLNTVDGSVPKPVSVLQKRHRGGVSTAIERVRAER
jgi:hypothetical protein